MAMADLAAHYAKKAKLGRAAENHAVRIRLEAERKAGSVLADMERQRGGRPENHESVAGFLGQSWRI